MSGDQPNPTQFMARALDLARLGTWPTFMAFALASYGSWFTQVCQFFYLKGRA